MVVDALKNLKKPEFTYNHTYIEHNGIVWSADGEGIVKQPEEEHYKEKKFKRKYSTFSFELDFTEEELAKAIAYLDAQVGKPYEVLNFLWHPVKTITGEWLGSRTDKQLYCYELVIRALNASGKYNLYVFMNPREFFDYIHKSLPNYKYQTN